MRMLHEGSATATNPLIHPTTVHVCNIAGIKSTDTHTGKRFCANVARDVAGITGPIEMQVPWT